MINVYLDGIAGAGGAVTVILAIGILKRVCRVVVRVIEGGMDFIADWWAG